MGRVLFRMLAGGVGGIIASVLMEPSAPKSFFDPAWERWQVYYSLLLGACIGGCLGLSTGWSQGTRLSIWRGIGWGITIGAVGGYVGLIVGGTLSRAIFGDVLGDPTLNATDILARMVVYMPLGGFVGIVPGAASRSWPRMLQGAIGGIIGAGIGGACFDLIGQVFGSLIVATRGGDEVGIVSRAATAVLIGALIGAFTAIVENLAKSAWVRLQLGRNEFKEWIVDAHQTFLGRDERAHIPLFGYPEVFPAHAWIVRQGNEYAIVDGGSPLGTGLNGVRVTNALLHTGDLIQIGRFTLEFRTKAHAANRVPVGESRSGVPGDAPPSISTPIPANVAGAPPAEITIVAENGPQVGRRWLVHGPLELGRECQDISLASDSAASRRHAKLTFSNNTLEIEDLNSTNGTFVNGARVTNRQLKQGDRIQIGSTIFRVE